MKRLIYILIILSGLYLGSCDEYVDIEPRGSAIATSLSDYEAMVNNGSLFAYEYNYLAQLLSDNIYMSEENLTGLLANTYSYPYANIYNLDDIFYDAASTDYVWGKSYEQIASCNYVINTINDVEGEQDIKDKYAAEMKVQRAYNYFKLVNTYGHHYGTANAGETGSGVPIVTEHSNTEVSIERESVNEVYELIVEDLLYAIDILDEQLVSLARPNKAAAQALLARVYFHMGDYTNALSMADAALAFNSTLNDYNTIYGFPLSGVNNPEYYLVKDAYNPNVGVYPNTTGMFTLSDELEGLYDLVNDMRISIFYPMPDGSFNYGGPNPYSYRIISGPTVPEIMLIKAEILARNNQVSEAMDVVNTLRASRYSTAAVASSLHILTATNQADAIQKIIEERRREFHVWGKRFFDVKRLNAIEGGNISLTRGAITWAPNSIDWAAPISVKVIETSSGQIEQNPRSN